MYTFIICLFSIIHRIISNLWLQIWPDTFEWVLGTIRIVVSHEIKNRVVTFKLIKMTHTARD